MKRLPYHMLERSRHTSHGHCTKGFSISYVQAAASSTAEPVPFSKITLKTGERLPSEALIACNTSAVADFLLQRLVTFGFAIGKLTSQIGYELLKIHGRIVGRLAQFADLVGARCRPSSVRTE